MPLEIWLLSAQVSQQWSSKRSYSIIHICISQQQSRKQASQIAVKIATKQITQTISTSSPDNLIFRKQLLQLGLTHLGYIFLEVDHKQHAPELQLSLINLPVLVLLLHVLVDVAQNVETVLFLPEVIVAEVGGEVVLHVAAADHAHQSQSVFVFDAFVQANVLRLLFFESVVHEFAQLAVDFESFLHFCEHLQVAFLFFVDEAESAVLEFQGQLFHFVVYMFFHGFEIFYYSLRKTDSCSSNLTGYQKNQIGKGLHYSTDLMQSTRTKDYPLVIQIAIQFLRRFISLLRQCVLFMFD